MVSVSVEGAELSLTQGSSTEGGPGGRQSPPVATPSSASVPSSHLTWPVPQGHKGRGRPAPGSCGADSETGLGIPPGCPEVQDGPHSLSQGTEHGTSSSCHPRTGRLRATQEAQAARRGQTFTPVSRWDPEQASPSKWFSKPARAGKAAAPSPTAPWPSPPWAHRRQLAMGLKPKEGRWHVPAHMPPGGGRTGVSLGESP